MSSTTIKHALSRPVSPEPKRHCLPGYIYIEHPWEPRLNPERPDINDIDSWPQIGPRGFQLLRVLSDSKLCVTLLGISNGSYLTVIKLYRHPDFWYRGDAAANEVTAYRRMSLNDRWPIGVPRPYRDFILEEVHIYSDRPFEHIMAFAEANIKEAVPMNGIMIEYIPDTRQLDDLEPSEITTELARRVIETLAGIHNAGVLHGDVAPRNVLVDAKGAVWWIDFDLAKTDLIYEMDPEACTHELRMAEEMLDDLVAGGGSHSGSEQWPGKPEGCRAGLENEYWKYNRRMKALEEENESKAGGEHESKAGGEHESKAGGEHESKAGGEHESKAGGEHESKAGGEHESKAEEIQS
ncbi:hypothetical protein EDC01DRAFT_782022 [Geopyxis carbonaria]|nr:hypothetical protein EDC01DRAFT_782022 [Geopyxis carbonaria]